MDAFLPTEMFVFRESSPFESARESTQEAIGSLLRLQRGHRLA